MPKQQGAGPLRYKLDFQARGDGDDGYGGTIPGAGPYATVFTAAASLTPLRGNETVMADRLRGVQPYVCRIRQSTDSRAVTAAWQAVDARAADAGTATIYQIKSPPADPDGKHAWLEFIVSVGVEA